MSVAFVTGASRGIGRAIALQLAREGAEVLVHGRDALRGAETVAAITSAGGRARFVAADLSDPADLQRLVDSIGVILREPTFYAAGDSLAASANNFRPSRNPTSEFGFGLSATSLPFL